MNAAVLFFAVPFLPVLLAPLLLLKRPRLLRLLLPLAPWVPATALLLLPYRDELVELPWLLFGTRLGIDAVALPLLLLATIAWTLAGWHARRTLPLEGQGRFFGFWLLTWCGNLSVFLTLDGASFYAAYALMTFAAYGLVVHRGRPEDYRAGRVYISMAVIGEAMLMAGLFLIAVDVGNPDLEIGAAVVAQTANPNLVALLMMGGFGVKMGLVGLHMWLPLAHPQAPVPASAVLSGVILKAGLIGWLRFLPLGQADFEIVGLVLLLAGFATAFFGVAVGLTQTRIKSLLAYSSVSQMGLIAAIVALALLDPDAAGLYVSVATLFALHHGLAKALLFLGADLVRDATAWARRLLWVPGAALAGLPLTSGALAKAAWKGVLPFELSPIEPWLTASSVLTTLLMARFLWLAWPREPSPEGRTPAPWLALLAASLCVPWLYAVRVSPDLVAIPFRGVYFIETLWPVLAGSLLAWTIVRYWRGPGLPALPEGDLLALLPAPRPWIRTSPVPHWRPSWQLPLAAMEQRMAALAPAVVIGAVLLAAAIALLGS